MSETPWWDGYDWVTNEGNERWAPQQGTSRLQYPNIIINPHNDSDTIQNRDSSILYDQDILDAFTITKQILTRRKQGLSRKTVYPFQSGRVRNNQLRLLIDTSITRKALQNQELLRTRGREATGVELLRPQQIHPPPRNILGVNTVLLTGIINVPLEQALLPSAPLISGSTDLKFVKRLF